MSNIPKGCKIRGPAAGAPHCKARACTYPFCETIGSTKHEENPHHNQDRRPEAQRPG
jgi:hypothetical protein